MGLNGFNTNTDLYEFVFCLAINKLINIKIK